MTSAPANLQSETARAHTPLAALLGQPGSVRANPDEETADLIPLSIRQTAGGSEPDEAIFAFDLARAGKRLQDLKTPTRFGRVAEVYVRPLRDLPGAGQLYSTAGGITFTAAVSDTITATAHGFENGDPVRLDTSGTLPAPLQAGVTYYVINKTDDTFELSASVGGIAVNITDTGTGTHKVFAASDADPIPLFWGEVVQQTVDLVPDGETAIVHARIEPYHFGRTLTSYTVYDPIALAYKTVYADPVFNPLIDGSVEQNKSDKRSQSGLYNVWIDPESLRTSTAETGQGQTASAWSVIDAATAIANEINVETFVKNFDPFDFKYVDGQLVLNTSAGNTAADGRSPSLLNVRLDRGAFLNQYLDDLLIPHGLSWYVALAIEPLDPTVDNSARRLIPRLKVFELGRGVEKQIYHQAAGETLDLAESNAPEISVTTSIADLANKIIGHGSRKQKQLTIELYPGWAESDDALKVDSLSKNSEDWPNTQFETKQNVWRLWVGNFAGDYNNLRTTTKPIPNAARDLSAVFTTFPPRRRRIEDCLTLDDNGRRRPPFVEYYSTEASAWVPVPDSWGLTILNDQVGVYFNAEDPPEELIAGGIANARVRITGTLTEDDRPIKSSVSTDSPNTQRD